MCNCQEISDAELAAATASVERNVSHDVKVMAARDALFDPMVSMIKALRFGMYAMSMTAGKPMSPKEFEATRKMLAEVDGIVGKCEKLQRGELP